MWLTCGTRQQQVACFCGDSTLIHTARNTSRDTSASPPPPPLFPQSFCPFQKGSKERWGGEGPPSLGSQPFNQTLSHPVNLKQSEFNSSCPSEATPAETALDSPRRRAHQLRLQRKSFSLGCSERRFFSVTHHSFICSLLYFKANEDSKKISDDGNLKVV